MDVTYRATRDLILRTENFGPAQNFYGNLLGLTVAYRSADLMGYEAGSLRIYVERSTPERGSPHGPVFEFLVPDFERARAAMLAAGCSIVEEDAAAPHCYVRDPFGLVFNIRRESASKPAAYEELNERLRALIAGERDGLANSANLAALLFECLRDVNWAGFYWLRAQELVLGAFQGRSACVRIARGRGVCGTAAASRATIVVPNVHDFPGHIACDAASRSEIVVPLLRGTRVLGVLDLDSPRLQRFDPEDAAGLEGLAKVFLDGSDLERLTD
jgi:GAF domain-containing protein